MKNTILAFLKSTKVTRWIFRAYTQSFKMDSNSVWGEDDNIASEVATLSAAELRIRTSLIDSEVKYFKSEASNLTYELKNMQVVLRVNIAR